MIAALPASSGASDDLRSYDLVWILHLVGDAHQSCQARPAASYPELRDARFYALFEVQYPQHYAFVTIGLRRRFKETWTYGRRGAPLKEQVRRARERQLREIARALRSSDMSTD